jgi:hypothetical protein
MCNVNPLEENEDMSDLQDRSIGDQSIESWDEHNLSLLEN